MKFIDVTRRLARRSARAGARLSNAIDNRAQSETRAQSDVAAGSAFAPRAAVRVLKDILAKNVDPDPDVRQSRLKPMIRSA